MTNDMRLRSRFAPLRPQVTKATTSATTIRDELTRMDANVLFNTHELQSAVGYGSSPANESLRTKRKSKQTVVQGLMNMNTKTHPSECGYHDMKLHTTLVTIHISSEVSLSVQDQLHPGAFIFAKH